MQNGIASSLTDRLRALQLSVLRADYMKKVDIAREHAGPCWYSAKGCAWNLKMQGVMGPILRLRGSGNIARRFSGSL